MSKYFVELCMALGCLLSAGNSGKGLEKVPRLTVPGSAACEQVLSDLAAAFNARHSGLEVIVTRSIGTSGGIKAVNTGACILGRAGRPLNSNELNKGLIFLPLTDDAAVFDTGRCVGIGPVSADRRADIYGGKITNWQQLGGAQSPIRGLIRQTDETSLQNIRQSLPVLRDLVFCDQAKKAFHDYVMIALLNKFSASIGFLTRFSIAAPENNIELLGIGGDFSTADNLSSGDYPMKVTYGLIFKKGRWIIKDMGRLPIARKT